MTYQERRQQDNADVRERNLLARGRLEEIRTEELAPAAVRPYFRNMAEFLLLCQEMAEQEQADTETKKRRLKKLYEASEPENYVSAWINPSYAAQRLGESTGKLLSALAEEMRSGIYYGAERRLMDLTILEELLLEVYHLYTDEEGQNVSSADEALQKILYYYLFDYCDRIMPERLQERLDPERSFALDIIMGADLSDTGYLYDFGEYISESTLKTSRFIAGLAQEDIDRMADTWTIGFAEGFGASGRTYKNKKTVQIWYPLGFERVVRKAVMNFRAMGLEPVIPRAPYGMLNRRGERTNGFFGIPDNHQELYDHRFDLALAQDKAMKERRLEVLRAAYGDLAPLAADFAGPAVMEYFGEKEFTPVNSPCAWKFTAQQEKLQREYTAEAMDITDQYEPESEMSFTIIAWPLPDIGAQFEDIFRKVMEINTLDNDTYRAVQQKMIDVLDRAAYAEVRGAGDNRTRLRISLYPLRNPQKETRFENCVSDVNIPLGEVFTSPVLEGTEGVLHVKQCYIGSYQFRDLEIAFEEGRTALATCKNFEDEAQNRDLVRQVILANHDWLPMGEFAIGTNTTAYSAAKHFGIWDKLPILIAEKTGPHFAVGDTCYSRMEDVAVRNPDGKEVIARDNSIAAIRKTDPLRAYFSCHTDITIPYEELETITAVMPDGSRVDILSAGRFVLPGTEMLNRALEENQA